MLTLLEINNVATTHRGHLHLFLEDDPGTVVLLHLVNNTLGVVHGGTVVKGRDLGRPVLAPGETYR